MWALVRQVVSRDVLKITNANRSFDTNEKRFHVPGAKVEIECHKCKKPLVLDLGDQYLSYPVFNKPYPIDVACPDCDWLETTALIVLRLTIEEAEH